MSLYKLGAAGLSTSIIGGFMCMIEHCTAPMTKCFTESVCRDTLWCILNSDFSQPGSQLNCEVEEAMIGSVEDFTVLTECIYDKGCRPTNPDDMKCRIDHTSGQANLTDVSTIEGKWWVIKGVNPHYDSFPCQHNRYQFDNATQQWINNVTWINTFRKSEPLIGIMPSVTVPYPGYFVHWYPSLN
jgi:hypothetical protein